MKIPTLAEARKFLVAAAGAIGAALTLGLLHGDAEHYATIAVAVITAIGTFVVPNATPAVPAAAPTPPVVS